MAYATAQLFGKLLKKYRLRAEFNTLMELGDTLAEKGHLFEDSTLSKWQTGKRTPDRKTLLALLEILIEKGGVSALSEANQLLEAANQGFLTQTEINVLPFSKSLGAPSSHPCQTPRATPFFVGRNGEITRIRKILESERSPLIALCGPGGIGKTALAIEVARLFKAHFPDGILWSKIEVANPMSVLAKIALSFNRDVSALKDLDSRSEIVRSILSSKKALLIFDDVKSSSQIRSLLPGDTPSTVVITSRNSDLEIFAQAHVFNLETFSPKETLCLFSRKLSPRWVLQNKREAEKIGALVGYLPLALNIILTKIANAKNEPVVNLAQELEKEKVRLEMLSSEDISARSSFELSYASLSPRLKIVFENLAVFGGEDFSLEAVSKVCESSLPETKHQLQELAVKSLIQAKNNDRFNLHPLLKLFAQEKLMRKKPFKRAVAFYLDLLEKATKEEQPTAAESVFGEIENILALAFWCYENKELEDFISFWRKASKFIAEAGLWAELEKIGTLIYQCCHVPRHQKVKSECCIGTLSWISFWKGDFKSAERWAHEGLEIAKKIKNQYLMALAENRLGYIAYHQKEHRKAEALLESSLSRFKKLKDQPQVAKTLLYLNYLPFQQPKHSSV